jgi:hypothetical protein
MRILIQRIGENIETIKDYLDIKDTGEVAHMLCEVEIIKDDLLEIWKELQDER